MIDLKIENNIATIVMDDGKANALNPDSLADLKAAFIEADEKDAAAIVLTGREGMFSGGFDLKAMAAATPEGVTEIVNTGARLVLDILRSPRPVVAACSGHAIAMGMFTILACDIRIGAQGAFKISANETANGMVLPVFGVELPRARINPEAYYSAIGLSRVFSADEAVAVGILDQAVPAGQLMEAAQKAAALAGAMPRHSYEANKAMVWAPTIKAIEDSLK